MKIYIAILAFFTFGVVSAQKVWSFNDCLVYAQENNLQVLASVLNEQVQEGNYKIARNEKLPSVSGSFTNSFSAGPSQNALGEYRNYRTGYQNDLSLETSIILFNNGNLRINEEKNRLLLQQYQFTTEKIRNDISLQLVGNYLTVLLNKELMIVDKNSLDTYQQETDRNQKLYDAGSIPLSTLYESRANLANAKQQYENSKIEVDRSLMILAMLLQKDYRDFEIEDVKVSDDIELPLINVDEVVEFAYDNQPEIKSSELGIEAAKKDIDLARTALFPTITGGYQAGTFYRDYFDLADKKLADQWYDQHSQILSIGVNIPIFNKGISKLRIEQSKINQLIQENQLDQEKLALKQTIQTSYFDVNSSYQIFIAARESVASSKLSYEFAQKSFNAGRLNVYDLNIARNNYFNAQSQMLQAKYSFLFRLKILEFYTGKPLQITSDEIYEEQKDIIPQNEGSESIILPQNNINISSPTENESEDQSGINNNPPRLIPENRIDNTPGTQAERELIPERPIREIQEPQNREREKINPPAIIQQNTSQTTIINKTPEVEIKNTIEEPKPAPAIPSKEESEREALIRERRLKLSQGSSSVQYTDEAQRIKLINERRAKLSRGRE